MARLFRRFLLFLFLITTGLPLSAAAQSTGSVVGRVTDEQGTPLPGVLVRVNGLTHRATTNEAGQFMLAGVPAGEREIHFERIGYRPVVAERVQVRAGASTEVSVRMENAPLALPGVIVEAQRVRLIEPEVSTTHEVIVGREIRELPVDRLLDIIELTTGVSEGHFRGGRIGQEVYVIDGLSLKNQFEASSEGFGLELPPTALEEIDVITGGFGAAYGAALSGVVSYTTRRGNPREWEARASLSTDHWAPSDLLRGFVGLGLSGGGPLGFLGAGTTLYADVLAHGMLDADPRAAGMTCLTPGMADEPLAATIMALRSDPATRHLSCPYKSGMFPNQRGDKYIAFARLDRPFGGNVNVTATFLRNRLQRQLYTSEFKYNPDYQLGQRTVGTLGTFTVDWTKQAAGSARLLTFRTALLRMDRYLGAVSTASLANRVEIGGFSPEPFEFIGEEFVRSDIERQIVSGTAVPGYFTPGGTTGSPFGPAAQGIFYTTGTPTLANWSRSDQFAADLTGSYFDQSGSIYRAGVSSKLFRVETYERAAAHLAGSIPNYARFFPALISGFAEADIETRDGMHFQFGVRAEAFRSGIGFRLDRGDFLSPEIESGWKVSLLPRVGAAFPLPGTNGRTAVRFNFGRVAQPPDFQYFLDSTIGDSLRTDVRRQGNPNLSFERGYSYEAGLSHLFNDNLSIGITAYRKNLDNLVTGSLSPGDLGTSGRFTASDFGSVQGVEVSLRGRWRVIGGRAGYALSKARGLTSGTESDSLVSGDPARSEYPLAFDRRHSADAALFVGRAAGAETPWSAALTTTVQSGYPLFRADTTTGRTVDRYLPWAWTMDLRVSRDVSRVPTCERCSLRIVADGRNILNRRNIIALRHNGSLSPDFGEVLQMANSVPMPPNAIPRESPDYSRRIDLDGDGLITQTEFHTARTAAAIDRYDPSLYYGEGRQLRLGFEVTF